MSVPYTDNEASEARQWSNRYGPPNAWTASLGTAARMIGRLLDERERLMAEAILRERARTNLDAAPAAIVPEPEPEPAARRLPAGGTGDTVHGASPEAGTGDTPVAEPATTAEPVAWGVANGSNPQAPADELARLRLAIRRLADQDATLSVQGGNVIVEMDATETVLANKSPNRC